MLYCRECHMMPVIEPAGLDVTTIVVRHVLSSVVKCPNEGKRYKIILEPAVGHEIVEGD
jgi:hypothetical protein